ncbi:MAG: magnesium transporter CorA family protein [Patescibacteria group bacterium]|nr:magnesium transporter CorA family protein [Patescibacteria group bacterium]
MRRIIKSSKITWIDITNPTQNDIIYLKKRFKFHPLILDELLNPSLRPKVELHKDYLFMVIYYPIHIKEKRETTSRELNIIVGKKVLITSHYKTINPLKVLSNDCRIHKEARKLYMSEGTGQLLYHILSSFWKNCFNKSKRIDKRIDDIQKGIFGGMEREMVLEISLVKIDIINFWRIIEHQKEILESLSKDGLQFFGKSLLPHFSDILGTYEQVVNSLETHKETILALENTNQSLLSTRINEIMRVLTIFSVILLPLTLISSIWGMNFPKSLPLTGSSSGFWVISSLMAVLMMTMIVYFRKKKWL